MKKILIEGVAVLITLLLALGIILLLFSQTAIRTDTFAGTIEKTPINITAPVYGQLIMLSLHEGDRVKKGQTLAILQILNMSALPAPSPLYPVSGTHLRILSPSDGVIGRITFAVYSTVAGAQTVLLLYTASSLEVQIFLPDTHTMSEYATFYALRPPDHTHFRLQVTGQIPTNVVSNIDPTMSVYRATCTNCGALLDNESIAIIAERIQTPSPIQQAWHTLLAHL